MYFDKYELIAQYTKFETFLVSNLHIKSIFPQYLVGKETLIGLLLILFIMYLIFVTNVAF